jgi:hypothetical protein
MKPILTISFILLVFALQAQYFKKGLSVINENALSSPFFTKTKVGNQQIFTSQVLKQPHTNPTPFIAISYKLTEVERLDHNSKVYIAYGSTANSLGVFEEIQPDEHASYEGRSVYSQIFYAPNNAKYIQFKIVTNLLNQNKIPTHFKYNLFNPGHVGEKILNDKDQAPNENTMLGNRINTCPCAQPLYTTRVQWGCPQGQGLASGVGVSSSVSHLIVHHSATSNTASDWNAVVLSIWNSHTMTNGWSDIGYNWLVAPNGVLYEGRGGGNNVTGAHFCGTNANTMGTCMIGTYTSTNVTTAARNKLIEILAWKCCNSGINPLTSSLHNSSGLTLNHISGHRDGCATSCPGDMFYGTFSTLRGEVDAYQGSCAPCPSPQSPTITAVPSNATICAPDSVQLTAAATNCSNCSYLWSNGATTASTFAKTSGPHHVTITSNGGCGMTTQVRNVTITPFVVPTLTIANSGCMGSSSISFNVATSTNTGTAPTYAWYVNTTFQTNGTSFTYNSPVNGAKVYCKMTSNATCPNPGTVTSDTTTVNCVPTSVVNIDGLQYCQVNPSINNGVFNVQYKLNSTKQVQIKVVQSNGQLVWQSQTEKAIGVRNQLVSLPSTASGYYVVEVYFNTQKRVFKIVVNK